MRVPALMMIGVVLAGGVSGNAEVDVPMKDAAEIRDVVAADWPGDRAACRPVPMRQVALDGFLGDRMERNRQSLLVGLDSPFPRRFEALANGHEPPANTSRLASDSDLYKWLEGACYVYAQTSNPELRQAIERVASQIVSCQAEDGYINTQVPPHERFDVKIYHDLYTAGHFFEAAVAHFRATGERALLDAACRWADYLIAEHAAGNPYFDEVGTREHPEYELALVRLSRATGRKEYLDFGITLANMSTVGPKVGDIHAGGGKLHAVRTGYLLAALADAYLETGDADLYRHLPGLWEELVGTRTYLTGGIGYEERIPARPYYLPQSLDYSDHADVAETCASVAMMLFSWRMHGATGESRCFDHIENVLYNHFLGALTPDHLGVFYFNPVRLVGDQTGRSDASGTRSQRLRLPKIHHTSCCMPNAWRFLGALPEYVFSYDATGLFVNLYTAGTVKHTLAEGRAIALTIDTRYPHDGQVSIRFDGDQPAAFALRLRIPAWCRGAAIALPDGTTTNVSAGTYHTLERTWAPGDTTTLDLPMPVRMITSDPRITANAGQVAFARGPLVYCLDSADVPFPVECARVALAPEDVAGAAEAAWEADLLGGIHVVRVPGFIAPEPDDAAPYTGTPNALEPTTLPLVPFHLRANRGDDNRWTTLIPLTP